MKAYRERAAEWHPDKKSHLDEAKVSGEKWCQIVPLKNDSNFRKAMPGSKKKCRRDVDDSNPSTGCDGGSDVVAVVAVFCRGSR